VEVTVARDADLQPGSMLSVMAQGKLLVVFKDSQGVLSALQDRCSHAEVRLSGGCYHLESGQVECPAHGARFDVKSGKQMCMPAVSPVRAYAVKVVDGNIVVEV
jgi:nitrite reductase/ring-hydroxylating ferredoxin subunit